MSWLRTTDYGLRTHGVSHARVRLAGVLGVRRPQLPHPEGDARGQPAGAEEVLPQGAQAHAAQGIAEEVARSEQRSARRAGETLSESCPFSVGANRGEKLTADR